MAGLRKLSRITWLLVGFVVLDVLWLAAMGSALDECQRELEAASSDLFGVTFGSCSLNWGPFLFVNALVIGFFVVRQVTRRACPVCAAKADRGTTVCRKCGYDFAQAAAGTAGISPAPGEPATITTVPVAPADEIEWLSRGERYLFGRTLTTPFYGIWDGHAPGPPLHRFPYTEHGKSEATARFAELRSSEPVTDPPS